MSKYSTSKELLCLAYCYNKAGRKVEAAKIAVKAMEEADAEELFETMDDEQEMATAGDEMENLSEEDLEMPVESEEFEEAEGDEMPEELPPAEDAVAKVMASRKTLAKANLRTLSGSRSSKVSLARSLRHRR